MLDRVGDLELAAPGWLDGARGLEDRAREHVDADEGEVGGRLRGLLHEARDAVGPVELGHAVVLRILHRGEEDEGVRRLVSERGHQIDDAVAQQVVAEVHDERRVAEKRLAREHRVREAERGLLLDVGDRDAEVLAVTRRLTDLAACLGRDDDPDLVDPGGGQRLDPVEEHRLVGHGHELLGARVGDRAQAGAGAAGEDESLELLHQ